MLIVITKWPNYKAARVQGDDEEGEGASTWPN